MPDARKRPCCICHHWFRPDPRVGARQRTCGRPECQGVHRRKMQAAWRRRHPDYFAACRILDRGAHARSPEPVRLPPPLSQLPWDIAQSEFGVKGADLIGVMGTLLVHAAQSGMLAYALDSRTDGDTLPPPAAQSEMRVGPD
jgi:hypothetical protein